MKKWIVIIGLLTHSSVGWSKVLMMECFFSWGESNGIIRLDTNKSDTSDELYMFRKDGNWVNYPCSINLEVEGLHVGCKKGDESIVRNTVHFDRDLNEKLNNKIVEDFKFLQSTSELTTKSGKFVRKSRLTCEKR